MKIPCFLLLVFLSVNCGATNWAESTVTDPIGGKDCEVHRIVSYGSYFYEWESKYDGVYWPHISDEWRWDCRESGYISFGNDFSDLTEKEIERISAHLAKPQSRHGGQFERLEEIYKLRNKDTAFWAWFYRVKAYWHQSEAQRSRYQSIPLLEKHVETLAPSFELVQLYFVLGDYYRRFEELPKANEYFSLARAVQWVDDEGVAQTGSEYIEGLIQERLEAMQRELP